MYRCVLVLALFVVTPGVPNWTTEQMQTEAEKFQGTWVYTSMEFMGKKYPIPEGFGTLTFTKDGKVTLKERGKPDKEATFKIDATKNPKEIDLVNPKEPDENKRFVQAIYYIDGDTLTAAVSSVKGKRPTSFDSKEGTLMTLKRQKP